MRSWARLSPSLLTSVHHSSCWSSIINIPPLLTFWLPRPGPCSFRASSPTTGLIAAASQQILLPLPLPSSIRPPSWCHPIVFLANTIPPLCCLEALLQFLTLRVKFRFFEGFKDLARPWTSTTVHLGSTLPAVCAHPHSQRCTHMHTHSLSPQASASLNCSQTPGRPVSVKFPYFCSCPETSPAPLSPSFLPSPFPPPRPISQITTNPRACPPTERSPAKLVTN